MRGKKLKSLSCLKQDRLEKIVLDSLPRKISMTRYSQEKAFKISRLVRAVHGDSYEWYGFTIADKDNTNIIIDIGLGENNTNETGYTDILPEEIEKYRGSLPENRLINGWIHSHGDLGYRKFSGTDEENHETVLSYVSSLLSKPIAVKEVHIKDMALLVEGEYSNTDLRDKAVSLITDSEVGRARIMETVKGGFSYAVVIDDEEWHEQVIWYEEHACLTDKVKRYSKKADIELIDTGKILTSDDIRDIKMDVREKIKPMPFYRDLSGHDGRERSILYWPWRGINPPFKEWKKK